MFWIPGENAQLPGGIDLRTALNQADQQGQVIHGSGGGYGTSGKWRNSIKSSKINMDARVMSGTTNKRLVKPYHKVWNKRLVKT